MLTSFISFSVAFLTLAFVFALFIMSSVSTLICVSVNSFVSSSCVGSYFLTFFGRETESFASSFLFFEFSWISSLYFGITVDSYVPVYFSLIILLLLSLKRCFRVVFWFPTGYRVWDKRFCCLLIFPALPYLVKSFWRDGRFLNVEIYFYFVHISHSCSFFVLGLHHFFYRGGKLNLFF